MVVSSGCAAPAAAVEPCVPTADRSNAESEGGWTVNLALGEKSSRRAPLPITSRPCNQDDVDHCFRLRPGELSFSKEDRCRLQSHAEKRKDPGGGRDRVCTGTHQARREQAGRGRGHTNQCQSDGTAQFHWKSNRKGAGSRKRARCTISASSVASLPCCEICQYAGTDSDDASHLHLLCSSDLRLLATINRSGPSRTLTVREREMCPGPRRVATARDAPEQGRVPCVPFPVSAAAGRGGAKCELVVVCVCKCESGNGQWNCAPSSCMHYALRRL